MFENMSSVQRENSKRARMQLSESENGGEPVSTLAQGSRGCRPSVPSPFAAISHALGADFSSQKVPPSATLLAWRATLQTRRRYQNYWQKSRWEIRIFLSQN